MLLPPTLDSRNVDLLVPEFRLRLVELLSQCSEAGAKMVPFFTLRGPATQGKLWCRSRSWAEASAQRTLLEGAGAPKLARYLKEEWCSTDRWATNALPGCSWHQWGEACDCFLEVQGRAAWQSSVYHNIYAMKARELGLESGALWPISKDPVHVQLRKLSNPIGMDGFSWELIESEMSKRFDLEVSA